MNIDKNGAQVFFALGILIVLLGFMYVNRDSMSLNIQSDSSGANNRGRLEANYPLIKDELNCTSSGGSWDYSNATKKYRCVYTYVDGGNLCTSSSQCQGVCMVGDYVQAGESVVGRCSSISTQSGCYTEIENFKSTGAIDCIAY